MSGTDVAIWVAGIVGIAVCAFGVGSLVVVGVRCRRPLEVVLGVGVALLTIWALVSYGDHLVR